MAGLIATIVVSYWVMGIMTGLVWVYLQGQGKGPDEVFRHMGFYIWIINPSVIAGVAAIYLSFLSRQ